MGGCADDGATTMRPACGGYSRVCCMFAVCLRAQHRSPPQQGCQVVIAIASVCINTMSNVLL